MHWVEALQHTTTWEPLLLTAKVLLVSGSLLLVVGVIMAYYLARSRSWMRAVLDFLVTVPLVFPPVALGFGLLLLVGRNGLVGQMLYVDIVFSFSGVVLAAFVAGLPLLVKPVEASLRGTGRQLAEVAAVLGKSEWQIFVKVLLPSIRGSVVSGWLLALGRGLGEVGMTLMLGGNVVGKTNTLSLEIYNAVFSGEFERAIILSCMVGIFSLCLFFVLRKLSAI